MKKVIIKSTNERAVWLGKYKGAAYPMTIVDTGDGARTYVKDTDIIELEWWSFIFYPSPKFLEFVDATPTEWEKFMQFFLRIGLVLVTAAIIRKIILIVL